MSCTKFIKWLSAIVYLVTAQSIIITGLSSSPEMLLPFSSLSSDLIISPTPLPGTSSQHITRLSTTISSNAVTQATMPSNLPRDSQSSLPTSRPRPSISSSSSSSISTQTSTSNINPTGNPEETDGQFFSDLKYIYIIAGVIMILVLIIILLIAVVGIMCQRRMFDRKQKKRKAKKSQQLSPMVTSVEVHPTQPKAHSISSPTQTQSCQMSSPTRSSKSKENTTKTSNKTKDVSSMSDFPLLCRVLQDYDSTQHSARQTSVTSSGPLDSPAKVNGSPANGTPQHQNGFMHAALINELESSIQSNVFIPNKQQPNSAPIALNGQSRARTLSEESSEFEASWGKSTTASYISGCRDSNDYDELESIVENLKKIKDKSPPRSPPKVPLKIHGAVPVLSPPLKPLVPARSNHLLRKESMKRSQSADDIFDDPKYTRLSVVSPSSVQPNLTTIQEKNEHVPSKSVESTHQQANAFFKQPLTMKRSVSTNAAGEILVGGRDYKEYMSLQQLLDLMETKIPSRETSAETEDREEQLYCPRVLRPMLPDDST